jgi:hypothetical protein
MKNSSVSGNKRYEVFLSKTKPSKYKKVNTCQDGEHSVITFPPYSGAVGFFKIDKLDFNLDLSEDNAAVRSLQSYFHIDNLN